MITQFERSEAKDDARYRLSFRFCFWFSKQALAARASRAYLEVRERGFILQKSNRPILCHT